MVHLECRDLSIGYNNTTVLDNINFKVNKGDYLFIIGDNGSGKSTLMKTILNLQSPIKGSVILEDKFNGIGYLPQRTVIQKDFPASVLEVVLSGFVKRCQLFNRYYKEHKSIAIMNLNKVGASTLVNKCFKELSGGQQQKVLLARALCATKDIILLDEPVTGLDPESTEDMYRIINDLNNEGITIIMISHDLNAVNKYAKHVLKLGDRLFYGSLDKFRYVI